MRNSPSQLVLNPAHISLHTAEKKGPFFSGNGDMLVSGEDRLLCMKVQVVVDDLTQIMVFIRELDRFEKKDSKVTRQIRNMLSKLHSSHQVTKYVSIITKYLVGIRKFLSTTNTKSVLFYKELFETAVTAMRRELDMLEKDELYYQY